MEVELERFLEYSETQSKELSADDPKSLKRLERIPSSLLYENLVRQRSRLRPTIAYLDLRQLTPEALGKLIVRERGKH